MPGAKPTRFPNHPATDAKPGYAIAGCAAALSSLAACGAGFIWDYLQVLTHGSTLRVNDFSQTRDLLPPLALLLATLAVAFCFCSWRLEKREAANLSTFVIAGAAVLAGSLR